jgi:hypothetical protein
MVDSRVVGRSRGGHMFLELELLVDPG